MTGLVLGPLATDPARADSSATLCAATDRACVLDRASATARTIGDGFNRSVALRAVAAAQDKAGLASAAASTRAESIASFRQSAGRDSVSLALTAMTLLDMGAKDDAAVMLGRAERALPTTAGFQRGHALRRIAEVQVRLGAREAAAATLKTALEAARAESDPDRRASELTVVGAALHAASMNGAEEALSGAMAAAAGIANGRQRADRLGGVAEAQFKAGFADAAVMTLRSAIQSAATLEPWPRLAVLQSIAVKQVSLGSSDAGDELDRAFQALGGAETNPDLRLAVRIELAEHLAKRGKGPQAKSAFAAAGAAARETGRAFALLRLAEALLAAGFPDAALIVFREAPSVPSADEARLQNPYSPPGRDQVADGIDAYAAGRVSFLCSFARRSAGVQAPDLFAVTSEAHDIAGAIRDPKRRAASIEYIARLVMDLNGSESGPLLAEAVATLVEVGAAEQRIDDLGSRMTTVTDTARRLGLLAHLQDKVGAASDANRTVDRIGAIADAMPAKRPSHDEVLEGLVTALTRQARIPEALQRAEAITYPDRRARALIAVADGMRP